MANNKRYTDAMIESKINLKCSLKGWRALDKEAGVVCCLSIFSPHVQSFVVVRSKIPIGQWFGPSVGDRPDGGSWWICHHLHTH